METYLGEIRIFAGDFAPDNWALCDGRSLDIAAYPSLYALIGTTFGGDGVDSFNLPDLRGRVPIGHGSGPGLTFRALGQAIGSETTALSAVQMPSHGHALRAGTAAEAGTPVGNFAGQVAQSDGTLYYKPPAASPPTPPAEGTLAPETVATAGGGEAHCNMMPSVMVNFIICIQ